MMPENGANQTKSAKINFQTAEWLQQFLDADFFVTLRFEDGIFSRRTARRYLEDHVGPTLFLPDF